jgi:hypothetical protein
VINVDRVRVIGDVVLILRETLLYNMAIGIGTAVKNAECLSIALHTSDLAIRWDAWVGDVIDKVQSLADTLYREHAQGV